MKLSVALPYSRVFLFTAAAEQEPGCSRVARSPHIIITAQLPLFSMSAGKKTSLLITNKCTSSAPSAIGKVRRRHKAKLKNGYAQPALWG